jgi:hypothetical protein
MKSFFTKISIVTASFFTPIIAFAQQRFTTTVYSQPSPTGTKNLQYMIDLIAYYLNLVLGLLMGVAVVFFVYHVIRYFIIAADGEGRKEAGNYVLYSVIGFFVILSFWGLVNIVQNTFGLENRNNNWQSVQSIFPRS